MPLVELCFEALWIWPPVASNMALAGVSGKNRTIYGREIHKDVGVMMNELSEHHNPAYTHQPERFHLNSFYPGTLHAATLIYVCHL